MDSSSLLNCTRQAARHRDSCSVEHGNCDSPGDVQCHLPAALWLTAARTVVTLTVAMTSSCKAVDAWMQHPTKRFMTDDIFTSLLRWNRLDPAQFQQGEHPIYSTQMSLSSMESGLVEAGLISAWYSPQGPMISNEELLSMKRNKLLQ